MVDMGLMETAPDNKFPNLVVTGPQAQHCDKQGMPDKDEIDALEQILDATSNFLSGVTPKVLAGTFTYNCQRLNYYYVKDTIGIRNAIARLYGRSYKDYRYTVSIKPDRDWKTYRTFLYPDEATLNWMENDKIIARMIKDGDSIKVPRKINFELYFKSDTDRKGFAAAAVAKGYQLGKQTETKKAPIAYGVVVSNVGPIKMEEINAMTADLKKEAAKHDGVFSGWVADLKEKSQK